MKAEIASLRKRRIDGSFVRVYSLLMNWKLFRIIRARRRLRPEWREFLAY